MGLFLSYRYAPAAPHTYPHQMPRILILFAHPALEHSRVHRRLIEGIDELPDVTFRDLYQLYPDFYVDVGKEQELLLMHDFIVWQHPLYWYSTPPLLKQYIDLVFEHQWAYGERGIYLRGKQAMNVLTAGGGRATYCAEDYNGYQIKDFLRPLEQTASLCGMDYLPPYAIHGTHRLLDAEIADERERYHDFLRGLAQGSIAVDELRQHDYSNDMAKALRP